MARNVWEYALLGGIQGGADGLARGMAEERRYEAERQLMADREKARLAYLDDQQQFRRETGTGGAGGSRSTSARVGAAGDVPFDAAEADKRVAYELNMKPEDLPSYARGDDLVKRTKMLTEDGSNPVIDEQRPENFDALVAGRLEELKALRGSAVYGKDFKDVAAGRATMDDIGRLDRIERGDKGAAVAKLADKGKGEYESLAGGGGVFSSVGGKQTLNAMGSAEANKDNAAAGESSADAKKKLRDAEDALKSGNAEKLYQQISSIRPVTENMLLDKPTRDQAARVLRQLMNEVERSRGGAPAPAPAASQRGGASARPASGTTASGTTWTRN